MPNRTLDLLDNRLAAGNSRLTTRDYILAHVLAAIVTRDEARQMVFKGGTAMRLCYFEDYRYSAGLDFSIVAGLDKAGALRLVDEALADCQRSNQLPGLRLTDATPPRIEYTLPARRKPVA